MNYEQIRAKIAEAVIIALPIDPDDSTCILRYGQETADDITYWSPLWGPPGELVEAIVREVMAALFPSDVPLPSRAELFEPLEGDPRRTGRWTCGCDSSKCHIDWSVGRDASADPSQVIRATCFTHGLIGNSESARCADNQGMRQQAQALLKLDMAHREQCR